MTKVSLHPAFFEVPGFAILIKPEHKFIDSEQVVLFSNIMNWFCDACLDNDNWQGQFIGTTVVSGLLTSLQCKSVFEHVELFVTLAGAHFTYASCGGGKWFIGISNSEPHLQ
jgi:hypothetical protein